VSNSTAALSQEVYDTIFELGCMFHKGAGQCPTFPSTAYYRVTGGDIWCHAGVTTFRAEGLRIAAKLV
jgi:hypothetical protein